MVIAKVYLDNILCFKEFNVDFTYPKKIVNSTIKNEFLEGVPNFKVKKVNILIGSNASGKTSFGKAGCADRLWQEGQLPVADVHPGAEDARHRFGAHGSDGPL